MKKKIKLIAILIVFIILLSVIAGLIGYLISMLERPPTTFDYGFDLNYGLETSGINSYSVNPSNTSVIMYNGTFDDTDNMKINDNDYSEFVSTSVIEGRYSATYSFEGETVGDEGLQIDFIDRYDSSGENAYAKIVGDYLGHEKVLKLYDGSTSGNYNYHAYHDFDTPIDYGTIEFWTLTTAYAGDQYGSWWAFGDDIGGGAVSAWLFIFSMDTDNNGLVRFYDGSTWYDWGGLYADNTWFHVRVDFETTDGGYLGLGVNEYNFYFDEVLKRDAETLSTPIGLEQIQFTSHGWDNTRHDYMDAIGFSWDIDYNIGDNLNLALVELNYTMDLDFSEIIDGNLISLNVSSYHYTNISTFIVGNIYDYNSGVFIEMFNSSNIVETENYFNYNNDIDDFFNDTGNLRIQYIGFNESNSFKTLIDYIIITIVYADYHLPIWNNFNIYYEPLIVGYNEIFQIDVYSNNTVVIVNIEIESVNNSFSNIYNNTWRLDTWNSNISGVKNYTIHIFDDYDLYTSFDGLLVVYDPTSISLTVMTLIIILGLLFLELIIYFRLDKRLIVKFPLIAVVYLFALIMNVSSLGSSLPLTPMIQIFLLFFESVVFLITSIEYYRIKNKSE